MNNQAVHELITKRLPFTSLPSKEVWQHGFRRNLLRLLNLGEGQEFPVQVLVDRHDGCFVSHPIAVVRCRPHRDQLLIKPVLITELTYLMRANNQIKVVDFKELFEDL